MNLVFDPTTKSWGHNRPNERFVWGLQEKAISYLPQIENPLTFPVRRIQNRIGPIIGLLTSKTDHRIFAGNRKTFRRIHLALKESGGIAFVFTPEGIGTNEIRGYFYNEREKKWTESIFPYPDLVYNRIPFREDERSLSINETFHWLKKTNIPFFNPHFFSKWDLYQVLCRNEKIKPFLPETHQIQSKNQLAVLLNPLKTYYFKPNNGFRGDGIFTITCLENGSYLWKDHENEIKLPSLDHLWDKISPILQRDSFIIQPQINLNRFENRIYDFRLHVQRIDSKWIITGIGIRCSAKDGITTHVPKGGKILHLHDITPPVNKRLIKRLSKTVAKELEKEYGRLGEFSMDIGRDQEGNYWIFEINSKPMVFDEATIQKRGLETLLKTFYSDTGFI